MCVYRCLPPMSGPQFFSRDPAQNRRELPFADLFSFFFLRAPMQSESGCTPLLTDRVHREQNLHLPPHHSSDYFSIILFFDRSHLPVFFHPRLFAHTQKKFIDRSDNRHLPKFFISDPFPFFPFPFIFSPFLRAGFSTTLPFLFFPGFGWTRNGQFIPFTWNPFFSPLEVSFPSRLLDSDLFLLKRR